MGNIIHSTLEDPELHEPKGHSTAAANSIYVFDGAGSGSTVLINDFIQYSSICVFFEQGTPSTRVITAGEAGTVLPLSLTYDTECGVNFSYNDTAKEVTYIGTQQLTARFDASFSIAMTVGSGITMSVWLQENIGSGWVTLDKTLAQRKFSSNDVGVGGMTALLNIQNGYKYRPVFSVDGACTIDVSNIIYNFTGLRNLAI